MAYSKPRSTVELVLERAHVENCLVCSPDCTPNANSFVDQLYDLFTEKPRPTLKGLLSGTPKRSR